MSSQHMQNTRAFIEWVFLTVIEGRCLCLNSGTDIGLNESGVWPEYRHSSGAADRAGSAGYRVLP